MRDLGILGHGKPWSAIERDAPNLRVPKRWSLHLDSPLWGEGRAYESPFRLEGWTPWGWFGLALTPGSRYVSSWDPAIRRYRDRTHWLQWAPS